MLVVASDVLMEAASERAWVRRRGTHTRLFLTRDRTVIFRDDLVGDGPVRGYGPGIDGKPDAGRDRCGAV